MMLEQFMLGLSLFYTARGDVTRQEAAWPRLLMRNMWNGLKRVMIYANTAPCERSRIRVLTLTMRRVISIKLSDCGQMRRSFIYSMALRVVVMARLHIFDVATMVCAVFNHFTDSVSKT